MKLSSAAIGLTLLASFAATPALSQETGRNDNSVLRLDFSAGDDTRLDSNIQASLDLEDGQTSFAAALVLEGAADLMGVNCDLVFDPAVLRVVSIEEAAGDVNMDGRSNVADVLTVSRRLGEPVTAENGFAYFDFEADGLIGGGDVDALASLVTDVERLGADQLFWTSNPNHDLAGIRESVERFDDPETSNANGRINDIVSVLLKRPAADINGFGFDGDARIVNIVFEVVGNISGGTQIRFEDMLAIDEGTVITQSDIVGASVPQAPPVDILP